MALSAFGQAFLENLVDLKTPERRSIVTLKDLAFENPSEASHVVCAIRQHIKQCPAAHRLPALYLVDCMVKTEPCPDVYAEQLSQALLEIFAFVWDNADSASRPALTKLCNLWRMVVRLDQKVVQACEMYTVPTGQASTSQGGCGPGGTVALPGFRGYPVTQQPRPRPSAPYSRPPAPIGNGIAFHQRVSGQLMHGQQVIVPPASFPVPHPHQPGFQAAAPSQAMFLQLPTYIQQQHPQLPYNSAPPQQHLPFTVRPVGSMHFAPASATLPIPLPAGLVPSAMLRMHAAPLPSAQQVAAPASPQLMPHSPQQPNVVPRSTEFPGPRALQELDERAVRDLNEASNRTRPAFLDASFLRNKRRAAQVVSGPPSRQWYPSVDLWLVGTTTTEADNVDGQAEEEKPECETEKLYFVEDDPSQPECAISGEAFERFYDPDSDKWCYKDAVVLSGDEAAKYNVMDGSIVKVQCLSGAPSKLQMSTLRAATASAAVADDLRQAAASQPALGVKNLVGVTLPAAARQEPAATTSHLAQPVAIFVKEEQHVAGVLGSVVRDSHSLKRHGAPGDSGSAFPGAKRVKLEVQ